MIGFAEIHATTKSRCCRAEQQIVQSRAGGFVSKNCVTCGKSRGVGLHEIPERDCPQCKQRMIKGRDLSGNYAYRCPSSCFEVSLYQLVPRYHEAGFGYHGLAIPGGE